MKILFDSSLLISAFVESHPKHESALSFLAKAKNREFEFLVSAHTILEVYSVLKSAPFNPKISPETAKKLIENNMKSTAKILSLSDKDYFKFFDKMCDADLKGGSV